MYIYIYINICKYGCYFNIYDVFQVFITSQCAENFSIIPEMTGASPGRRNDSKNSLKASTNVT